MIPAWFPKRIKPEFIPAIRKMGKRAVAQRKPDGLAVECKATTLHEHQLCGVFGDLTPIFVLGKVLTLRW